MGEQKSRRLLRAEEEVTGKGLGPFGIEFETGKNPYPQPTLSEILRYQAGLALEDYLENLSQWGEMIDETEHENLERGRLRYRRLLEAAGWAEDLSGKYPAGWEVPGRGNHGN